MDDSPKDPKTAGLPNYHCNNQGTTMKNLVIKTLAATAALSICSLPAFANCDALPSYATLKAALDTAVGTEGSGLDFDMWATIVDRDGIVCQVAFSGGDRGAQWPGSRAIAAQKANTANAFSLDGLALSTANLFSAVQPGGSLYGLQHSNPVDTDVAYGGPSGDYGTASDPMVGGKIGGVNVFGGGLALYSGGAVVGAVGVSGDTSCADHMIGWRVRDNLGLDDLDTTLGPAGLFAGDATHPDNIIYDIAGNSIGANQIGGTGISASGFGHPACLNTGDQSALPAVD